MHAHTAQVNGIVGDIRMIVEMRPFSRLLALAKDTPPPPPLFQLSLTARSHLGFISLFHGQNERLMNGRGMFDQRGVKRT